MKVYKKNLADSEYQVAFDTYCEKVWAAMNLQVEDTDKGLLKFTEILDLRQKAMIKAYKKYGPVYYNYLVSQLMQPLQNSWIRLCEYADTKNVKYLIDVLNFLMLGYWYITDKVEDLPDEEALLYVKATMIQLNERNEDLRDKYLAYLEMYSDSDELSYLALIAYYIYCEILNPTVEGAFYNDKPDGRVCAIAGIYINQYM